MPKPRVMRAHFGKTYATRLDTDLDRFLRNLSVVSLRLSEWQEVFLRRFQVWIKEDWPRIVQLKSSEGTHRSGHAFDLPLHRVEAGYPNCSTCDGGGCPDCTDSAYE